VVTIVNKKLLGCLQLVGGAGLIILELLGIFGGSYELADIIEIATYIIVGLAFILMGIDNIQ
jgi:hypothetical protein